METLTLEQTREVNGGSIHPIVDKAVEGGVIAGAAHLLLRGITLENAWRGAAIGAAAGAFLAIYDRI